MLKTEVIVIGAGPAGAVAAYFLATAGAKVLLVDKEPFPRDKTCGDGVTMGGLKMLDKMGLQSWVSWFNTGNEMRLTSPDGQVLDIPLTSGGKEAVGRIIPRIALDARLVQSAVEAGAVFKDGLRVQHLKITQNGVLVHSESLEVEAQLAILADGGHAPISCRLGLAKAGAEMIAARQYLAGDSGATNRIELHFQPGIVPGYSWLFPAGLGRINLGTGTYMHRVNQKKVNLHAVMAQLIADYPVDPERLAHAIVTSPIQSHPLRTQFGRTRTHARRILVAGDAAELVSPFSGEGINPAMQSGEMAAAHAITALQKGHFSAAALSAYSRTLKNHYTADHRAARLFRLVLDRPALINRLFQHLQKDSEMASLVAQIIIDQESPRQALRFNNLRRLLF